MRRTLFSSAFIAVTGTANFAGGMAEPIQMKPKHVANEAVAASSRAGILVPLILLAILAVALSNWSSVQVAAVVPVLGS